jgi:hypothetical protein
MLLIAGVALIGVSQARATDITNCVDLMWIGNPNSVKGTITTDGKTGPLSLAHKGYDNIPAAHRRDRTVTAESSPPAAAEQRETEEGRLRRRLAVFRLARGRLAGCKISDGRAANPGKSEIRHGSRQLDCVPRPRLGDKGAAETA